MARSGRPQDVYGVRAKRAGYPARSVYKLEDIDRRFRLLRPGQRVLDLGASPGSWLLYAASAVGLRGHVLGIDLEEHRGALPLNAQMRVGDARTLDAATLGGPGSFDVVLSDMAPSTSGIRHLDQYRSYELFTRALEIAVQVLVPGGGAFVGKLFQGAEFPEAQRATALAFAEVRVIKPRASRSESYEIFIAGLALRRAGP